MLGPMDTHNVGGGDDQAGLTDTADQLQTQHHLATAGRRDNVQLFLIQAVLQLSQQNTLIIAEGSPVRGKLKAFARIHKAPRNVCFRILRIIITLQSTLL